MTAASIAELLNARQTGPKRWTARCPARCPAHPDGHPSLSIAQGDTGTLLRCWAGCRTEDVLKALGLRLADLFSDADTTPQQRREAVQQRRERDAESRAEHHAACGRNRKLLKLGLLASQLGGLLVRRPDDREIGRLFHSTLDKVRVAEAFELELHP